MTKTKLYYNRDESYHIEGGDILNLNEHILAVGISQRTKAEAIDELAKNLFKDKHCQIDTVLAFNIPNSRAFMHLDTVFTQIDTDKFTIHPGILGPLSVYKITKGEEALTLTDFIQLYAGATVSRNIIQKNINTWTAVVKEYDDNLIPKLYEVANESDEEKRAALVDEFFS